MFIMHEQLDGQQARVRVDLPLAQAATTAVLIVQSGRMARYDQPGYESELYERLTGRLMAEGLAVVRFDIDQSVAKMRLSTAEKRAARTRRLSQAVAKAAALARTNRLVLLGASLGALSVIDILADERHSAVVSALLIGCVLERPHVLMSQLARLELIYGSRDCIVYVDEAGTCSTPAEPSQYAQQTADNLVRLPHTEIGIHLLGDAGHLLDRIGAQSPHEDALDLLVALVSRAANDSDQSLHGRH